MTTEDDISQNTPTPDAKPLGFWLRTVDALLSQEFATAFDGAGAGGREWMILNVLSGDVDAPGFAERLARKGKRLGGLAERGWVQQQGDGTWTITDEGRAAQARLGEIVEGIRSRVAGTVSPEDFATTLASLEAIARELGWDENAPKIRRGYRPGFGRRRSGFPGRPGFGAWAGRGAPEPVDGEIRDGYGHNRHHGFRPGFGPGGPDGEHHCESRGGHRDAGGAERAYERGFDAGFARGTAANATSNAV